MKSDYVSKHNSIILNYKPNHNNLSQPRIRRDDLKLKFHKKSSIGIQCDPDQASERVFQEKRKTEEKLSQKIISSNCKSINLSIDRNLAPISKRIKIPRAKTRSDYFRGIGISPEASKLYLETPKSPSLQNLLRVNSPVDDFIDRNLLSDHSSKTRSQSNLRQHKRRIKINFRTLKHSESTPETFKYPERRIDNEKSIMEYFNILNRPPKPRNEKIKFRPINFQNMLSRRKIKQHIKLIRNENGCYSYSDDYSQY
ncbi:unnamed protein product [Blepharisma stoltei]|uniref:Uncharacterized protein n=1 Tax=Blepharisma stoltei TaxID=1481888 RepID=A0AAU9JR08_9CILI|nr:unnamed protein product [Blepharisma stoltei]